VVVGGHPLAGSERQGVEHAQRGLFEGRVCVLTPTAATPPDRLQRARGFWTALGCRIVELDPVAHDETLAATSHLPHVLAAALAAAVPSEVLALAAGAYRDATRVAGSDAALWTAIFLENRAPLLHALDRFESHLGRFRQALDAHDEAAIRSWWEVARARRGQFDNLNANAIGRIDD
jgi:prephenate dehydrogenase